MGPRPFLGDFGLAKDVRAASRLTRSGETLGTPAYMSPEQARGDLRALTPATDVWALGCVLYEAVAGRPAFGGETAAATIAQVLAGRPAPLDRQRGGMPRDAAAFVGACLAPDPRARPGVAALRADCARLLAGERPRHRRPGTRRWRTVGGLAATLVGAAAIGWTAGFRPTGTAGSAGVTDAEERAQARATRAAELRQADPTAAIAFLDEALRQVPVAHPWRLDRGLLCWAVGQPEVARAEWDRIPPTAPEHEAARLYHALVDFFALGDGHVQAARAVPALQRVAAGTGRAARLAQAALAIHGGRYAEAGAHLADLQGWEVALLQACRCGWDPHGDDAAALAALDVALRDGIPFAWAYSNRSDLRRMRGDMAGARADAERALALHPAMPEALVNLGLVLLEEGDAGGAAERFSAALAARPGFAEAHAVRGLARKALGDPHGARADLDAAIAARPTFAMALANRVHLRLERGDLAGAVEDADAAVAADPRLYEARQNRGAVRMRQGDHRGALEDFTAALATRPGNVTSLNDRGECHRTLGNLDAARADYSRAIAIEPEHVVARHNRALVAYQQRRLDDALDDLDRAVALRPAFAPTRGLRAKVRWRQGDLVGALADVDAAIAADPAWPEAHANRGLWLGDAGRWAEGAASLRRYLALEPQSPLAAELRRKAAQWEARAAAGE